MGGAEIKNKAKEKKTRRTKEETATVTAGRST